MRDEGIIRAPWSAGQVEALNRYQKDGRFHPYTCGKRDTHPYQGSIVIKHEDPEIDGKVVDVELDILIATTAGWVCPCPGCDYTQGWAHAFTAEIIAKGV